MKNFVLAAIAAAGLASVASLPASAIPVDGAAIARAGEQVSPVASVAYYYYHGHRYYRRPKAAAPDLTGACPNDQERNSKGFCRPNRAQR
jgi:opacity protein-like surface antigen